jgi:hypothetical protein
MKSTVANAVSLNNATSGHKRKAECEASNRKATKVITVNMNLTGANVYAPMNIIGNEKLSQSP